MKVYYKMDKHVLKFLMENGIQASTGDKLYIRFSPWIEVVDKDNGIVDIILGDDLPEDLKSLLDNPKKETEFHLFIPKGNTSKESKLPTIGYEYKPKEDE